jgi:hypothetical protein
MYHGNDLRDLDMAQQGHVLHVHRYDIHVAECFTSQWQYRHPVHLG